MMLPSVITLSTSKAISQPEFAPRSLGGVHQITLARNRSCMLRALISWLSVSVVTGSAG